MTLQDAQKIISKHLEAKEVVQEIEPLTGKGFVNQVYILSTPSSKLVLRIDPQEESLGRFQKESWCMQSARDKDILVPEVFGIGMQGKNPYILISYIEGTHGEDADPEQKKLIWEKLGEYNRKIHAIKTEGYGENMTSPGIFNDSWSRFIEYNIAKLNNEDKLVAAGIITADEAEVLRDIFINLQKTSFNFGLIHNDLSLKNTILKPNGEVYLLDWGSAQVSIVPHMDIAEILHSSLNESSEEFSIFLKAYGMANDDFNKIKTYIHKLQLLVLIDKVRWAMDRDPKALTEKAKDFRQTLASLQQNP